MKRKAKTRRAARKGAQRDLVSSSRMLKLVLDNIPQRVFWKDRDSVYLGGNPAFARDCGFSDPEQLIGKTDFETISAPMAETYRSDDKRVMETGLPKLGYEEPQLAPDGGRKWLRTNKLPLRDAEGRVIGVLGTYEDITERKRAERALRLMHFSVEHATDPVCWVDPEARFLYVNPAFCRHAGYSGAELLKLGIAGVDPDFSRERWQSHWNEIRRQGALRFESRTRAKDGSLIPVDVTLNHLEFEGEELGFAYVRDISERKRGEVERARLFEFEKGARAEAEAASRAKDEFLAIVSHELRTPMTAILGWNWLLRSGELDAVERERALAVIDRNMQLQKQIIEDLLDVSSLARRQLSLHRHPVELAPVFDEAAAGIRAAGEAKRLTLACRTVPGLVVDGDPDRLRQIFWNLLSNAVKYTPEGGRITAELRRDQAQALLSVEDTGPGISPEFFPHLFELFRQQEESLTREHRGLGLGLAIIKHLVELHGGSVWADPPTPGRGARFSVALPLCPAPVPGIAAEAAAADLPIAPRFPVLKGVRVFVVEDDDDTRQMLVSVLSHCGAEVEHASGASDAFARLPKASPDVLICDISMPGEDGCSLLERIRLLPPETGGRVPAAALTAYATAEDRTRILRSGFDIHLPKPVDPAELLAVVRALARKR
ncbi:MAG: PAS domain-containing protein [Elusimicrobia bacterium]|nr:PAS domain-containing protein [Elusimicrobiota bacterium]